MIRVAFNYNILNVLHHSLAKKIMALLQNAIKSAQEQTNATFL